MIDYQKLIDNIYNIFLSDDTKSDISENFLKLFINKEDKISMSDIKKGVIFYIKNDEFIEVDTKNNDIDQKNLYILINKLNLEYFNNNLQIYLYNFFEKEFMNLNISKEKIIEIVNNNLNNIDYSKFNINDNYVKYNNIDRTKNITFNNIIKEIIPEEFILNIAYQLLDELKLVYSKKIITPILYTELNKLDDVIIEYEKIPEELPKEKSLEKSTEEKQLSKSDKNKITNKSKNKNSKHEYLYYILISLSISLLIITIILIIMYNIKKN
jgi:hypothetical protein